MQVQIYFVLAYQAEKRSRHEGASRVFSGYYAGRFPTPKARVPKEGKRMKLHPNSLEARLRARLQAEGQSALSTVFRSARAAQLRRLQEEVRAEARTIGLHLI